MQAFTNKSVKACIPKKFRNNYISKYYGNYNILEPNWGSWFRKGKYITHYTINKRKRINVVNVIDNFKKFESRLNGSLEDFIK